MSHVTGTPRKVTLKGITFRVAADTDIKEVGGAYENTSVPTSGDNVRKMVKRSEDRESVTIIANGTERDMLKTLADGMEDFAMSYETASGDVYRATGWIEFEGRQTAEDRCTITLHPRQGWQSFLA